MVCWGEEREESMKKTLVVKPPLDVGEVNDAQIEFLKAYCRASFSGELQERVEFDVLVEDEESLGNEMIQHIRKEIHRCTLANSIGSWKA